MRICWVISEEIEADSLDMKIVREVAPSWGSWKTWKEHKTENCISTNLTHTTDLIKRAFHAICNFYIPQDHYTKAGSPMGVKLFDGTFKNNNISNKNDLVALNLATPGNDIVLMSGFNFSATEDEGRKEYYFNVCELMKKHSTVQFVLVDYEGNLDTWAEKQENLTLDTIDSVKNLLI